MSMTDRHHQRHAVADYSAYYSPLHASNSGGRMPKHQQRSNSGATDRYLYNIGALMKAVKREKFSLVRDQLAHGIDPNELYPTITDADDERCFKGNFAPLHIAAASTSSFVPQIVDQLLNAGANPNLPREHDGKTPVHLACLAGNRTTLWLLLKKGGNQFELDRAGRSALSYAEELSCVSGLSYAQQQCHLNCLELLRQFDGKAEYTPATPQKKQHNHSIQISPVRSADHHKRAAKLSRAYRHNSLTSVSSGISDYQSCVQEDDDDDYVIVRNGDVEEYDDALAATTTTTPTAPTTTTTMGNRESKSSPSKNAAAEAAATAAESAAAAAGHASDGWGDEPVKTKTTNGSPAKQQPKKVDDDDGWGDAGTTTSAAAAVQQPTAATATTVADDDWANTKPSVPSKQHASVSTNNNNAACESWGEDHNNKKSSPSRKNADAVLNVVLTTVAAEQDSHQQGASLSRVKAAAGRHSKKHHHHDQDQQIIASSSNGLFHAERYRVLPSAPPAASLLDSNSQLSSVIIDRNVNHLNDVSNKSMQQSRHDANRKHKHGSRVKFRESRRGEFIPYEALELLTLREKVARGHQIVENFKKKQQAEAVKKITVAAAIAAAAAAAAAATDDSAIESLKDDDDDDDIYDSELEDDSGMQHHCCERFDRHHRHRHSSRAQRYYNQNEDYEQKKKTRSRSAGNITTSVSSSSQQTSKVSRHSEPAEPSSSSKHRRADRSRSKSRERQFYADYDAAAGDYNVSPTVNQFEALKPTAAALHGFLACVSDKQLRQLLEHYQIVSNPVISTETRPVYKKMLVKIRAQPQSPQHASSTTTVTPTSSRRYTTPPRTTPSSINKRLTQPSSSTAAMTPSTTKPYYAQIAPRKLPQHQQEQQPQRQLPIIIYPPVGSTVKVQTKQSTDYYPQQHRYAENVDDNNVLCRKMEKMVLHDIARSDQHALLERLRKAGHVPMRTAAANSKRSGSKTPTKGYFVYLLLDPRELDRQLKRLHNDTSLTGEEKEFIAFMRAIFYIGKGKRARPMDHFREACDIVLSAPIINGERQIDVNARGLSVKTRRILECWNTRGGGVMQVQCFHSSTSADAYNREAVMIDAVMNCYNNKFGALTNAKRGSYYGAVKDAWTPADRRMAGAALLDMAFRIYLIEGASQLHASEIEF